MQLTEIGIAGEHQLPGAYRAGCGADANLGAVVDPFGGGVFVQTHAQRLRRGGLAQGQVEWMQVARTGV